MKNDLPYLPPAAHEVMVWIFPRLKLLFKKNVPKCRVRALKNTGNITHERLDCIAELKKFIKQCAREFHKVGFSPEYAIEQSDLLGMHCYYLMNFEMHRRKMFWVDSSLADMFHHTDLDIVGEALALPFPTCAFAFTDKGTLDLGKQLLAMDGREADPIIITVYLIRESVGDQATGLNVNVLIDCQDGDWPDLLSRSLLIHPRDNLDTILDSHFPDIDPEARDEVFTCTPFKKILHLVFNAVLYSTTLDFKELIIHSPHGRPKKKQGRPGKGKPPGPARKIHFTEGKFSKDSVFYLPGKIDISPSRTEKSMEPERKGEMLSYRFMVRGHWRGANPSWKDQQLRWIKPYWRGPEDGPVVEKEYRLKM